eukprot:maker-scaffold22_size673200-snap-gene-3.21 protein:Tk12678 transcript:maker-scaffold22_size673200-snap-gene-3.21-mRNA-1 annotation:"mgc81767 protein"
MSFHLAAGGQKLVVLNCASSEASASASSHCVSLHEHVPASHSAILNSSWSSNGSCLASCVRQSDKIILTYAKRNVFSSAEIATGLEQPLAVVFPRSTQRKLFVGNAEKVILYDIAKKKAAKEFVLEEPLRSLDINASDQYLGVGGQQGSLYLLNNLTNQASAPLRTCETDALTSVHFCHGYKSRLATSNDAGSVHLWDCNTSTVLKTFREHSAPCTGLASFPYNDILLLSSGLDKKCIGYDVKSGETCTTLKTDYPLTSVAALLSGNTIALGTSNGKVLIYDLRNFKRPQSVVQCQATAVRSLVCQPPPEPLRALRPQVSKARLTVPREHKENIPSPAPGLNPPEMSLNDVSLGSQVFSPLKSVSSPALSIQSVSHSNLSVGNVSQDSLFSPLRDQRSWNSPAHMKTPLGSFNQTPLISPLTMIREEDAHDHDNIALRLSHSFISEATMASSQPPSAVSFRLASSTPESRLVVRIDDDEEEEEEEEETEVVEESVQSTRSEVKADIKSVMMAFPKVMKDSTHRLEDSAKEHVLEQSTRKMTAGPSGGHEAVFQEEFMKACVEEAMDEFCADVKQQMWHLQYDIIRAFQDQKREMGHLLQGYAVNEALLAENQRLKDENDQLRHYY